MAIKISGSTIIDDSRNIVNAGISTFGNDVTLTGASYNATWDASDSSLIFNDNAKAKFGTGGDLEISHNGTNGIISSSDTIRVRTPYLNIQNSAGNENIALFYDDADGVHLYNDNTVRFCTTGYGVKVVGSLCATTLYGDGSNLTGTGFGADAQQNLYAGTGAGAASDADTCNNIALGFCAGNALNSGDKNVFLGLEAGKLATSGENNIYIGCQAGEQTTSAGNNVFLGQKAGHKTTDNSCGIAIGFYAAACRNSNTGIFIGRYAGHGCNGAGGACNIAIGDEAGKCGTTGSHNVFLGTCAGRETTNCSYNVFAGTDAGRCSDGGYNVFFGRHAGQGSPTVSDNTGGCNIAIGAYTQCVITSGTRNVTLGENAGRNLNIGFSNVFLGASAGKCVTTGNQNIFLGNYSGCGTGDKTGQNNIGLGKFTAKLLTSGCYNIFFGKNAGCTTTSGCCNIAIGREVELPSATGNGQLAIGDGTNRWITGDSSFNVCLAGSTIKAMSSGGIFHATKFCGDGSCLTGITASGTGAIGGLTVKDEGTVVGTAGSISTFDFVGSSVVVTATSGASGVATVTISGGGFSADSQENLYAGTSAGAASDADTCFNVAIGYSAGSSLNAGDRNVFLGTYAGKCMTTSGYNVAIGADAGCNANPSSGGVYIGRSAGQGAGGAVNTGFYSVMVGEAAGKNNCGGDSNTFVGACAGCSNRGGDANIFLGRNAGAGPTSNSHCWNTYIGCAAGNDQTDGQRNIIIGCRGSLPVKNASDQIIFTAGNAYPTPPTSWFYGCCLGGCIITGIGTNYPNNVVGSATTSKLSVGIVSAYKLFGDGSALTNLPASGFSPDAQENLAAGTNAGAAKDGDTCFNIFLGKNAGCSDCAGDNNVYIGCNAGKGNLSGENNIFLGRNAGCNNTTGYKNVFVGDYAGAGNVSGYCNVYLGHQSAGGNQTGQHNFVTGYQAGYWGGGNHNFIAGQLAYTHLCGGNNNIAIGNYAGYCNCGGSNNIYFGERVAYHGTGNCNNILMGYYAANNNGSSGYMCCAENNIGFGCKNLFYLQCGSGNIALGNQAGCNITDGNCNVVIGYGVTVASATGNNQFIIGSGTSHWICGDSSFNIYDKDGNQLNGASSGGGGGGLWSQTSVGIHTLSCVGIGTTNPQSKLEVNVGTAVSAFDIQGSAGQLFSVTNNLTSGSIFSVNDVSGIPSIDVDADGTIQLAPFSTTEFVGVGTTNPTTKLHVIGEVTATDFNSTSDARLKTNVQSINDPLAKILQINGVSFNWIENNKPSMGVIADNIEEVVPELVNDTDPKTVNYNGLIGLLIEVVKEQQTQIDSLNERLSRLE